jgi:cytochrome c556
MNQSSPRRLPTLLASLSLVAGVAASSCATTSPHPPQQDQLAQALAAPDRHEPPQYLSNTTRELLRARMASHANEMGELVSAIMILQYPGIAERAAAIEGQVDLARPISTDATDLASALPPAFFDYQDELKARARALEEAAEAQGAFRVADAYGDLSKTCVKCHSVFRGAR